MLCRLSLLLCNFFWRCEIDVILSFEESSLFSFQESRNIQSPLSCLACVVRIPAQLYCHPGVSQVGWFINVCAFSRMDVKLDVPSWQHSLVDVQDPTVSFSKSRRAIAGTMKQIPDMTTPGKATANNPGSSLWWSCFGSTESALTLECAQCRICTIPFNTLLLSRFGSTWNVYQIKSEGRD